MELAKTPAGPPASGAVALSTAWLLALGVSTAVGASGTSSGGLGWKASAALAALTLLFLGAALARGNSGTPRPGLLSLDAKGLRFRGRRLVRHADVARVDYLWEGCRVVFRLAGGGSISAEMRSEASAKRLVRAARAAGNPRDVAVPGGKVELRAGSIAIKSVTSVRVVPLAAIAHVARFSGERFGDDAGIELVLTSGERVAIPTIAAHLAEFDRAGRRIEAHVRAAEARRGSIASPVPLARRGRRTSEWVRSLRALGSGASSDHRRPPVRLEGLWRVAEDPLAEPELRAGAAVALAASLDGDLGGAGVPVEGEGARRRLAALARRSPPALRVVFERSARGADEPELIEALERAAESRLR